MHPLHRRAYLLIVILGGMALGLSIATAVLLLRLRSMGPGGSGWAQLDEDVREQAIREIVSRTGGLFDSFPDPDVLRTLIPHLDGHLHKHVSVSTNSSGMREEEFEGDEPKSGLRIIFLGDSYVYGSGVEEHERMGAALERELRKRAAGFSDQIVCWHLGLSSWNIGNETEYLRRQISLLKPDLVFHLLIANDIDDSLSARGFGGMAGYNPRYLTGVLRFNHGIEFGKSGVNTLARGLDFESLTRMQQASRHISRLAQALEDVGCPYRVIVRSAGCQPAFRELVVDTLDAEQVLFLPNSFNGTPDLWLSEQDHHWNPRGHQRFAEMLFGWIQSENLLALPELEAWPEAQEEYRVLRAAGWAEASRRRDHGHKRLLERMQPAIDFTDMTTATAKQVYGGIDRRRMVAPHAVVVLPRKDSTTLRLQGQRLGRPELAGGRVRISLDGQFVHEFELGGAEVLDLTVPIPEPPRTDLPLLSVRFEADDWVYHGAAHRQCGTFEIAKIWVE